MRTVRRRDEALLEELFPGPGRAVPGPGGHHAIEVVVPLVAGAPADVPASAAVDAPPVRRVFPPGSEWTYVQALRRLGHRRPPAGRGRRSAGPAPRRVGRRRFAGSSCATPTRSSTCGSASTAIPTPSARPSTRSSPAWSTTASSTTPSSRTYRREVERYGGPEGILVAERVFHADSDAVVELLDLFEPGAAGLDARWRIGLLGTDRLLARTSASTPRPGPRCPGGCATPSTGSSGPTPRCARAWPLGSGPSWRRSTSCSTRRPAATTPSPPASGCSTSARPASPLPSAAGPARRVGTWPSPFVHMWLNRLHRSENRFHEYVTYALLARLHEARARRPGDPRRRPGPHRLHRRRRGVDVGRCRRGGQGVGRLGTARPPRPRRQPRSGPPPSAGLGASCRSTRPRPGSPGGAHGPRLAGPPAREAGGPGTVRLDRGGGVRGAGARRPPAGRRRWPPTVPSAAPAARRRPSSTPRSTTSATGPPRPSAWPRRSPPTAWRGPRSTCTGSTARARCNGSCWPTPAEPRPLLVGAAAGDVVGARDVEVARRRPGPIEPGPADPDVAARARAEVVAAALRHEVGAPGALGRTGRRPGRRAARRRPGARRPRRPATSRRPARRIRRFPTVFGIDETDCGAACLAAVCRHFGRSVPLPTVRDAVATAVDGTSLGGLATGAERLGLTARRPQGVALPARHPAPSRHLPLAGQPLGRPARLRRPLRPGHGPRCPGPAASRGPSGTRAGRASAACVAPTPALARACPRARRRGGGCSRSSAPTAGPFAVAVALGLAAAGLEMLIPLAAGRIVDGAIAEGDRGQLHVLALGMLGVLLAAVTAGLVQRWLLARVAVRFDAATLDHITERLLALPASYFASRRTGDIERRVAGMRQIRIYLVQQGVVGMTAAAQVVVAVVDHGRPQPGAGRRLPGHRSRSTPRPWSTPAAACAPSWPRSRSPSAPTTPARSTPSAASTRSRPGAPRTPCAASCAGSSTPWPGGSTAPTWRSCATTPPSGWSPS